MAKRKRPSKRRAPVQADAQGGRDITLDIRDMAAGGRGLGFHRGRPVFVPYTIPGETITAQVTGERGKATFARGLRLRAASADRVSPRCRHFGPGRCWSCHWQHIAYPAQLLLKQDLLADQLSRLGKLPDALIADVMRPVTPARQQWAYNQALRLTRDAAGAWGLRREKRDVEAISECHVTHPELLEALAALDLDYTPARSLTLRRGSDGRIMLIFGVETEAAPELHTDLPVSVNLVLPDREPINLIGDAHTHYSIADQTLRGNSRRGHTAQYRRRRGAGRRSFGRPVAERR